MNAGILPIALLCATLGLVLSLAAPRLAWRAFAALVVSAALVSFLPISGAPNEPLFFGLWVSMIATAAIAFIPAFSPDHWAIPAAINAGGWSGALASSSNQHTGLAVALLLSLLFIPGRWVVHQGYSVALKVAASWMIAIATLSTFVSMMPTPGYRKDHME